MYVLRFGTKLNDEVCRGFIFTNHFNSPYLLVRLLWNILVANLATNFQDFVAKVKNLVALAPVLGAISRPGLYKRMAHLTSGETRSIATPPGWNARTFQVTLSPRILSCFPTSHCYSFIPLGERGTLKNTTQLNKREPSVTWYTGPLHWMLFWPPNLVNQANPLSSICLHTLDDYPPKRLFDRHGVL